MNPRRSSSKALEGPNNMPKKFREWNKDNAMAGASTYKGPWKHIPNNLEFARKQPKAKDEFEKINRRSLEALAFLILHPGVIKFWALNPNTMEAYKLQWNGGSLKSLRIKYDSKVFEATSYKDYNLVNVGLLLVELDMIKAYKKN